MIQWHKQVVNITTNIKVKIDFTLPKINATKIVTWDCHVDDSDKGRCYMILGRDILTALGLNLKFSKYFIKEYYGPLKGLMAPMVDLDKYE